MVKRILFYLFLLGVVSNDLKALPHLSRENCYITTLTEYKDGENKRKTYSFYFKKKAECLKIKKLYTENFSSQEIKKITVKMDWRGG